MKVNVGILPFSPAAQTPGRPVVGGNGATDNWLVVWRTTAPQFQVAHGDGSLSGAQQSFTTPPLAAGDTLAVSSAPAAASGLQLVVWSREGKHIEARYFRPLDAGFRVAPAAGTRQPTVVFTDTTAPLDQADTWAWNFGDGHGSAAQHPQHTYTAPGGYTVTLTVSASGSGESESLTLPHAITVTSLLHSHVITYTYDPLQRLTAAAYSTGETYGYAYDAVGNRTVMTDATGVHRYTYDAANRLTGVQLPDSSVQTYTWDARGNLLTDGANTYTYNAAGRMVRAANLDATLTYTYTADGLRVQQAANGDLTAFVWDWAAPVPELLQAGDTRYLVGHDTLGQQVAGDWRYYLPDALGSARQSVDAAGTLRAAREWRPYGEEIGAAQAGLGFTGEWFDAAVGLQYLRARWYQPGTGRFTSRDPWEGDNERPQTLTMYEYVENNPIMWVDPSGLTRLLMVRGANAHHPEGLALRSAPSAQAKLLGRVRDGTRVITWEDAVVPGQGADTNLWRSIGWIDGVSVWSAMQQARVWAASSYLVEAMPGTATLPNLGSPPTIPFNPSSDWRLPLDEPIVYMNGYGYYDWAGPRGDSTCGLMRGSVSCECSGPWETKKEVDGYGCFLCLHNGWDLKNPEWAASSGIVYAMGAGIVKSSSTWSRLDIAHNVNGMEIEVQYTHVFHPEINVNDRVEAGQKLGEWGAYDTSYPHLHMSFKVNNRVVNPQDYWPGNTPTAFTGRWGNPIIVP